MKQFSDKAAVLMCNLVFALVSIGVIGLGRVPEGAGC